MLKTQNLHFTTKLLNKLSPIREYPLTIVEAPMGYGKTTAIRHFHKATDDQVLWLKIYDDSIDSFWDSFARLLGELKEEIYYELSSLGFPDDSVSMREVLRLLNNLKFSTKYFLVLDDYHLLKSPEVDLFLTMLIENKIENLHIVLITRYTSFEKMEELSLKGQLYHLTREAFELREKDITEYYQECSVTISQEQARMLHSMTEGWISALYLMLLNFIEDGILKPTDSIYKLIEKTVYKALTSKQQDFITRMSVFNHFSLRLAAFIWGKPDTAAMLDSIVRQNAFIAYDQQSKTYQIHSLFRNYLQEKLEEDGQQEILTQKAAAWYLEQGEYTIARQFLYACGDFEQILNSIEEEKARLFTRQNMATLRHYLDECPEEIRSRHHYALLILCVHFLLHNEFAAFTNTFKEVAANIGSDPSLTDKQRKTLYGEFELIYGVSCFNNLNEMAAHFEKSRQLLTGSTSIYDLKSDWTHGSLSVLYLYHRESGKLLDNIHTLKIGLPCYESLTKGNGRGGSEMMAAEYHYNQGDFLSAEVALNKALHKAQPSDQWGIVLAARFLQMRIDWMKGDFPHIFHLQSLMQEEMASRIDYHYLHNLELCQMYFYAQCDQKYKIPESLARPERGEIRLLHASFAMFNIIYGRVLLINEHYTKLIGSGDYFLETAGFYPNMLGVIYTHLYLAAGNAKLDRPAQALESLKKALDIAMPDGLYMPFAENSDYLRPILKKLAAQGIYKTELRNILALSKTYQNAREKLKTKYFPEDKQSLTDREKEIALLAAQGLTNKAIADKLFISANTVKSALKSVYSKLSINNRTLLKQHFEKINITSEV
ncbi:LuxR C-terminal-related transcriptional regulator [Eubacteriaceae bacterium ES3]|nr:LuxR C-terminal-related transcriptional regulator [Eubacteriaceae bacterium ES3]